MSRGHCPRSLCAQCKWSTRFQLFNEEKRTEGEGKNKHDLFPKFRRLVVPLRRGGQRERRFALLRFQKHVSVWHARYWCVLMRDFPPVPQPVTMADSEPSHTEDKWSQSMVINHICWWERQEFTPRRWKNRIYWRSMLRQSAEAFDEHFLIMDFLYVSC